MAGQYTALFILISVPAVFEQQQADTQGHQSQKLMAAHPSLRSAL